MIGKEIEACFNDWGIWKLFAITVDNASTNNTAIDYIKKKFKQRKESLVLDGEFLHLRCCAHIVNLIVNDGLKEKNYSISSTRNAVKYVRSSPSRLLKFKECVKEKGIKCKKLLCLDVPTRWNSTYLMLECAIQFQKAFERIESDATYRNYFAEIDNNGKKRDGPPCDEEWDNARIFVKFLQSFYEVTLKFSGSAYVTSNLYFQEICEIQNELVSLIVNGDGLLAQMANSMKKKFDKYWGDLKSTNGALILSNVLDSRCKLSFVTDCYETFYDVSFSAKLIKDIEDLLLKTFDHYSEIHFGVRLNPCENLTTGSVCSQSHLSIKPGRLMSKFMSKRHDLEGGNLKNEVDKYLAKDVEDFIKGQYFDILTWWMANSNKYPVLSLIARDVLVVPVTTIPFKSAFSIGGRILNPFRSSLTPRMVEALICLKNWMSDNNKTVVVKDYMDEVEVLESCEQLETEFVNTFASVSIGLPLPRV